MDKRLATCKLCNKTSIKIKRPKTPSGFILCVDEAGKAWCGSVCPVCAPSLRKNKYRPSKKANIPEIECKVCRKVYTPRSLNTKGVCSSSCAMKYKRSGEKSKAERGMEKELTKITME